MWLFLLVPMSMASDDLFRCELQMRNRTLAISVSNTLDISVKDTRTGQSCTYATHSTDTAPRPPHTTTWLMASRRLCSSGELQKTIDKEISISHGSKKSQVALMYRARPFTCKNVIVSDKKWVSALSKFDEIAAFNRQLASQKKSTRPAKMPKAERSGRSRRAR